MEEENYLPQMLAELQAYMNQLNRHYTPVHTARFTVVWEQHDLGLMVRSTSNSISTTHSKCNGRSR